MGKRIVQLDGVRTLAISAVFLHHALKIKMLWAGVDLFFILSGFLITGILIDHKHQDLGAYFTGFYKKRARRILPPYLLLLVIVTFLVGFSWLRHWYLYLFLMNWLLAFWIPHPQSLDLLWSLAVEEQFYLLWPFAVYWLSEFAIGWLACGLLLLAPVLRWTCTPMFDSAWPIYALTPFRMDLLAAGALLSVAWRHHRDKIERFGSYGLLVSVASCGALYLMSRHGNFTTHSNTVSTNVWVYEMSLFACTGVIVWALSGRGVQMLRWAPVAYVGRISYSIYLIHTTILFEILGHFGISVLMRAALGALGSVAYAALSWKFLEGPLLKNRREQTEETVRAY